MRIFLIVFLVFAAAFAGYITGLWRFAAQKAAADKAATTTEQHLEEK